MRRDVQAVCLFLFDCQVEHVLISSLNIEVPPREMPVSLGSCWVWVRWVCSSPLWRGCGRLGAQGLVSMRRAAVADKGWGFYAFVIMKILIIQL
jgi:hypothetical protein